MMLATMLAQMPQGWHRGGLYLGMHWAWWIFWILALLIIFWAFWQLYVERREERRERVRAEEAEELLRERFARGEIDEEEFARRLRILRETGTETGVL